MILSDDDLSYYWLGPLGGLRKMPLLPVTGSSDTTEEIMGGILVAFDGTATQQVFGHRRSWSLDWTCLTPDEVAPLRCWYLGLIDAQLRIVDPRARNRLTRDGSTGGSYNRTTDAHVPAAGTVTFGTVTDYPAALSGLIDGAVSWAVPATTATTLTVDETLKTLLVPAEGPITVSVLLAGTGSTGLAVRLYDAAGALNATTTGTPATLGGWAWQSLTVTPSGNHISAVLVVTAASGSARTVRIGPAMWAAGDQVLGWVPGDGCPAVLFEGMPSKQPGLAYQDAGAVLREV